MTRLNTELQPLPISYASQPDLGTARRLIVPVTNLEADLTTVTQRVWELAGTTGAKIKFIGLCTDPIQEPSFRRALVTMSAMVTDDNVYAEMEILPGRDIVGNLRSRLQPGDLIVCVDGQYAGLLQKPLSQVLQSELDAPLYILSGLSLENRSRSNWLIQAVAWIGSIAIIVGFFMLQVRVNHLSQDWTIVLQVLTTAVELWLLWAWNSLLK